MDTGYVTTLTALVILNILGFDALTALTLCDNTNKNQSPSRSSFPRSDICHDHRSCVDGGKTCSFAKLSCQSGHSIYNPVVQGLHSSDTVTCTGLTPHLMMDTSSCYWTNMCTIDFPEVPMIVKHLVGEENCVGKCIHAVHVRSWQCVKDTQNEELASDRFADYELIHKMCDETKDFIIGIASRQGVVRSHEASPFLDSAGISPNGVMSCNKTFYPHLKGNKDGFTMLALSVIFLDIQNEFETLRAVSKDKTVEFHNKDTPTVHVFPKAQTVVLSLKKVGYNSKDESRVGGSGFVICFKFVQKGEFLSSDDVCGQVFKPNRRDAKCVNCKYKRRGKLVTHDCGGNTQGLRIYNVTLANPRKQTKDGCSPWTMMDKPCKKKKKTKTQKKDRGRPKDKKKRTRQRRKGGGKGKKRGGSRNRQGKI